MAAPADISVLELRRLLIDLRDKRPDICFRCRLIGEMWLLHFMRIVVVNERSVILNDEVSNKLLTIRELNHIMQFEIDHRFQNFQPYFHYGVTNH